MRKSLVFLRFSLVFSKDQGKEGDRLALKTEGSSKDIARNAKKDVLKPSLDRKPWTNEERSVLVNPFSRFTETTVFSN